jgi:hypothetical protein
MITCIFLRSLVKSAAKLSAVLHVDVPRFEYINDGQEWGVEEVFVNPWKHLFDELKVLLSYLL